MALVMVEVHARGIKTAGVVVKRSLVGVGVTVTVPVALDDDRVRIDELVRQVLLVVKVFTSVVSWSYVGDDTCREEPGRRVTTKLVGLTVIDWMTAEEPVTFSV